jgi:hypothetical protein
MYTIEQRWRGKKLKKIGGGGGMQE